MTREQLNTNVFIIRLVTAVAAVMTVIEWVVAAEFGPPPLILVAEWGGTLLWCAVAMGFMRVANKSRGGVVWDFVVIESTLLCAMFCLLSYLSIVDPTFTSLATFFHVAGAVGWTFVSVGVLIVLLILELVARMPIRPENTMPIEAEEE
jgi:hypothetical protein